MAKKQNRVWRSMRVAPETDKKLRQICEKLTTSEGQIIDDLLAPVEVGDYVELRKWLSNLRVR